jgi:methanogenic corrinoid protein MtbC1
LSAATKNLPTVASAMEAEGIKDKVTLMIGGEAVDEDDAEEIGAMYGESKEEAVIMAKKVMEGKK